MPRLGIPDSSFIFSRCDIIGDCWVWSGSTYVNGYGSIIRLGKGYLAHRIIAIEFCGVTDSDVTDHLCRNRLCCNPEHLEAVSIGENVMRGVGLAVNNARKTHCKQGHELTAENIYSRKDRLQRGCKICRSNSVKKNLERKLG